MWTMKKNNKMFSVGIIADGYFYYTVNDKLMSISEFFKYFILLSYANSQLLIVFQF